MKDYKQVGDYIEGFAKVRFFDGKYGFVHIHGKLLEGRYDEVVPFEDGLAYVKYAGGRWMPINKEGSIVTPDYNYKIETSLKEREENKKRLKSIIDDKIDGLDNYIDNMFDHLEDVKRKNKK